MSRLRLLTALTIVAALALAGVATAKVTKVTGGSTTITLSSAAIAVMSANHLTATPITPATASGSTFSFPILGGRLNKELHGFVTHRGGFAFSNGTRTIRLRHLTVDSNHAGVSLWALVPQSKRRCRAAAVAPHLRCHRVLLDEAARIARLSGVSVNLSTDTATGTVHLTRVSAGVINKLSGKQVVKAGAPIGTATVTAIVG
jgi:hypothetical protein